uniref:ENT domain-containing protein n=1 Tax=Leersia perrieri TaxID=77586 RepID=A0A0D9V2T7_9ORYZ
MRINTGMKVEAWRGTDTVMGGWRMGVVVWGNGHQYKIQWDDGGEVSGRIRRVSVRPLPPPRPVPDDLEHGDLVEVFDECMWRLAEFVRSSGDEFTVKIVATPNFITVPCSLVRVRQVLTDRDIWVATYKGEEIPGAREPTSRPAAAAKPRAPTAGAGKKRGGQFAPPPPVASGQWAKKIKKSRHAIGGGYDVVRQVTGDEIHSDSICALEDEQNERYMRKYHKYHNLNVEMEVINVNEPNSAAALGNKQQQREMNGGECEAKSVSSSGSSSSRSRSEDDSDDDRSDSDGSSSSSDSDNGDHAAANSPPRNAQPANQPPPQQPQRVKEELADADAEANANNDERTESRASAMQQRRPAPAPAVVAGQIHDLELDAYEALMRVFHATGTLTWEKEELLTQLRMQLHISGDEHLQLIRTLHGGRRRAPKPDNVDA